MTFGNAKRLGGYVRRHRLYVDGIALKPKMRVTESGAGLFSRQGKDLTG